MNTTKSSSVCGWRGKILQVDLSREKVWEEDLSEELRTGYIGGSGINARLLYTLVRDNPRLDSLSPDNPLIFGFGPLVGTSLPSACRFTVTAKSPLTNIFGDSSAGGYFAPRAKQAGYDHIVVRGKSDKPVALFIEDGKTPKLIDAADLWGLDTYETDEKIRERFGECESARIGPAGEHLVRYANIFSGTKRVSANGRAGMGCVMGSKKLKAIIVKTKGTVPVADAERLGKLSTEYRELWGKGHKTQGNATYGTLLLFATAVSAKRVNNDQVLIEQEQVDRYDPEMFVNTYKDGKASCYRCPVGCSQKWKVEEGPYKGKKGDKIEFGHIISLGTLLGIYDYPSLFHLADLTNKLGMDCIQFGWNMAMAMECFQRGILGSEDTDGLGLEWGDVNVVAEMIARVAKREGFGNIVAESIPEMVRKIGPEAKPYGFHTKGMSFPYPSSSLTAMCLANVVGVRGADHLKGHPYSALIGNQPMLERIFGKEIPEEIIDPTSPVAKGRVVWWHENHKMLLDSLGLCFIPVTATNIYGEPLLLFEELGELYEAVTGKDPKSLFESTERAYQVERSYNALSGISTKDDKRQGTMREREDPVSQPGMLDEYYLYRGCSKEGVPTRKRLLEVGLSDVVEDLTKGGTISDCECPAIDELLP